MAFKNTQDPPRVAPTTADIAPSLGRQYVTEDQIGMLVSVANSFDPVVTGLAAKIGTIAFTADGSKAWRKYAAANTAWIPLHDTVTPAVAADTVASLSLSLDDQSGWEVSGDLVMSAGTNETLSLVMTLNGGTTPLTNNTVGVGCGIGGLGNLYITACLLGYFVAAGGIVTFRAEFSKPRSGYRLVEVWGMDRDLAPRSSIATVRWPALALTSVEVVCPQARIGAGSQIWAYRRGL